ncbi:DUF6768 family protein [Kordiimonas sp. SCSIO 12610]|uniref:DUF6768 family protein n=1 Tax=Kordiimonas sp. SCSIO 12610 TaxID=2829597 RepID=UPI00210E1AFD|nr:DUF6768 family protein [Kordiimonas sp. SCSIO 12610]UTW54488.1 hypothetical protein KFF44_11820 [Kordiimonas sp. SCSIO 12610]
MTSIDERIKAELEAEAKEIDAMVASDDGLPGMLANSFKGGMRRWVWLINVVTFAITMVMFWTIYEFWFAPTLDDRVFWGMWVLLTALMQSMAKMWMFNEMNRQSLLREIKRLELALERLSAKMPN